MQEDRVCNASVAASMREKYPDIFDDWPIQTVIIEINCVMPGFVGEMTAHVMPQTLEECHRVINGLFADLINARDIQQTLMQEIELLRPDAERYRAIKKTNQKNATKSKKVSMI